MVASKAIVGVAEAKSGACSAKRTVGATAVLKDTTCSTRALAIAYVPSIPAVVVQVCSITFALRAFVVGDSSSALGAKPIQLLGLPSASLVSRPCIYLGLAIRVVVTELVPCLASA